MLSRSRLGSIETGIRIQSPVKKHAAEKVQELYKEKE